MVPITLICHLKFENFLDLQKIEANVKSDDFTSSSSKESFISSESQFRRNTQGFQSSTFKPRPEIETNFVKTDKSKK